MAKPLPVAEPVSFFINYDDLLDAFTRAKQVITARAVLPVLTCALLSYSERADRLFVTAGDLDRWMVTGINQGNAGRVHGRQPREPALLPVVSTLRVLKSLGAGESSSWNRSHHEVQITVYRDSISISAFGLNAEIEIDEGSPKVEDFPKPPDWHAPSSELARVKVAQWRTAMTFAAVARGKDDTLPMLTGVLMMIDGDRVDFASTDRYRLAVCGTELKERASTMSYPTSRFLLPAGVIAPSLKLGDTATWGAKDDTLRLRLLEHGDVLIRDNTHLLISRPMDATFPPYNSLIPTAGLSHWTVGRAKMLAAVKTAVAPLGPRDPVRVRFSPEGVTVGRSDVIPVKEKPGRDLLTSFNGIFLVRALEAFKAAYSVTFSGTAAAKPWLINGSIAGSYSGVTGQHLLMPVRIPGAAPETSATE